MAVMNNKDVIGSRKTIKQEGESAEATAKRTKRKGFFVTFDSEKSSEQDADDKSDDDESTSEDTDSFESVPRGKRSRGSSDDAPHVKAKIFKKVFPRSS